MSYEAFSALIVEASPTKRSYLWQATLSEPSFGRVKGMKSLEEALAHLQEGNKFHVLLLSKAFSRKQLSTFITNAKNSSGGKESAYVLVLSDDDQTRETVALSMNDGMDGFLFSPFSVDSLKEVARIAASIKLKFETEKRKASLRIIIPEVTQALDDLALSKIKNKSGGEKEKSLKNKVKNLKEVAYDFREIYIDMLAEICAQAEPRKIPAYEGASERVKAMMDKMAKRKAAKG